MFQKWQFFNSTGRKLATLVFSANQVKRYGVAKPGTVQLEKAQ
jgi:hypothetical protein